MELIWKEIEAERLVGREKTQLRIEGELPSPDGVTPSDVLSIRAKALIDSTEVGNGEVKLKGRVVAYATVSDSTGRISSYESKAGFEQTVPCDAAGAGMNADVFPCIQSVTAVPKEGGVSMRAEADMDIAVTTRVPMKVTGGINGVDDLEIKTSTFGVKRRISLGTSSVKMREELAAEGAAEVVSADGQLTVRDVSFDNETASVSGLMTVSAVTADSAGHYSQLVRQVPFRESVSVKQRGDNVFCSAELVSLYLHALGEDFGLISMEAEVKFDIYTISGDELTVPVDAFSPSVGFDCLKERAAFIERLGRESSQLTIKETVTLPDNAPEMASAVSVSVSPLITEIIPDGRELTVNGLLSTNVIYESTSGRLTSFTEDVPFTASMENTTMANSPTVSAYCVGSAVGTADRSVQIQYTLLLNAELTDIRECDLVTGLAEKEINNTFSGIVICFANGNDGAFDIAKRYSVPCETVRMLNPEATEPYTEGERLLLIV